MTSVRIGSVAEPLASQRAAAQDAATLVARGDVMGFLPAGTDTRVLDAGLIEALLAGLAAQGVSVRQALTPALGAGDIGRTISLALEQSEHSPMPRGEWPSLGELLGEDLLGRLLGISPASVRRYSSGARPTPQAVAARLHVLALIVADLAGGYNEFGIRRWFLRPRTQLEGQFPLAFLGRSWDPEGAAALRLRGLAAGLVGAGAT